MRYVFATTLTRLILLTQRRFYEVCSGNSEFLFVLVWHTMQATVQSNSVNVDHDTNINKTFQSNVYSTMTFSVKNCLQKVTEFTKREKYHIFPIIKNATWNEASEVASSAMKHNTHRQNIQSCISSYCISSALLSVRTNMLQKSSAIRTSPLPKSQCKNDEQL